MNRATLSQDNMLESAATLFIKCNGNKKFWNFLFLNSPIIRIMNMACSQKKYIENSNLLFSLAGSTGCKRYVKGHRYGHSR